LVAFLAQPLCAKRGEEGLCFADILKSFKNYFYQTNYLNMYLTDPHPICTDGRTTAVDERSEVIFCDPSRDAAMATNYVGKIDLESTHLRY